MGKHGWLSCRYLFIISILLSQFTLSGASYDGSLLILAGSQLYGLHPRSHAHHIEGSLMGLARVCAGYDACGHLSEETARADVSSPIGVIIALVVSAVFGWLYILALLFSVQVGIGDQLAQQTPRISPNGACTACQRLTWLLSRADELFMTLFSVPCCRMWTPCRQALLLATPVAKSSTMCSM